MKGVTFITDETHKKRFVQIDLDKYGEIWEDFYDVLIAESRKDEPSKPLDEVLKELEKEGKLDG